MKIRPGKADRKEKASSVHRLRQSTKDESMKRFNVDNQQDLRPRYLHFISLSLSRTGANGVKTRLALIEKKTECKADNARQRADIFGYNISGNQTRLCPKKIL